jgi:hypothetical protein
MLHSSSWPEHPSKPHRERSNCVSAAAAAAAVLNCRFCQQLLTMRRYNQHGHPLTRLLLACSLSFASRTHQQRCCCCWLQPQLQQPLSVTAPNSTHTKASHSLPAEETQEQINSLNSFACYNSRRGKTDTQARHAFSFTSCWQLACCSAKSRTQHTATPCHPGCCCCCCCCLCCLCCVPAALGGGTVPGPRWGRYFCKQDKAHGLSSTV